VVKAIDAVDSKVLLVGHSAGAGIAYAALDARPDRVEGAVYVAGFPLGEGEVNPGGYTVVGDQIPLPDWQEWDDADLAGLDDSALVQFRARAIPSPAFLARDPQRLSDDRRYDVPVTMICTEFSSEMLRGWIERGLAPVREYPKFREVTYVDLPTGHWPQLTRPSELVRIILR
jgi:pimeloyl-ACP methyl ester carboxylesterase